jgi:parallel beta-helix repeat protein
MPSRRSSVALAVFVVLAALVVVARWLNVRHNATEESADSVVVSVTNGGDHGPGTLREALFIVATAPTRARILVRTPRISLDTPLPPLVNPNGISIAPEGAGTVELDAHALKSGPVFDVAGPNTSITGLLVRRCPGAGILLRAPRFKLQTSAVESCDVGVDVAENAREVLLERNRFQRNRVGIRFAASSSGTTVTGNDFKENRDAGLWAVRSDPDTGNSSISVRENQFSANHTDIVAGNVNVLIERNVLAGAQDASIHIVGNGAIVRGNRVSGGPSMGIIAENARGAIIENNELDGLSAYGVMVRGSSNTLVRANRVHNSGYGLAFVLGEAASPSTAVDNTIIEPKFNGIDVIGDSPILRRNQVLHPHALALHVEDFTEPDGKRVLGQPLLDGNSFASATHLSTQNFGKRPR